jgi:hypothetical protein
VAAESLLILVCVMGGSRWHGRRHGSQLSLTPIAATPIGADANKPSAIYSRSVSPRRKNP